MNKLLLTLIALPAVFSLKTAAQCTVTPPASTFILSSFTVGNNYTLNGATTYPIQRAFYICQGVVVTLQNRPGNDTFYVATGGKLIGFEPNAFKVILDGGATYDATNSGTATIYYETTSTISNFTGPMLPPCPSVTINMNLIGSGACGPTSLNDPPGQVSLLDVFPNPASEQLQVSIKNLYGYPEVRIFDMLGKVVFDEIVSGETTVNISGWPCGVYNVVVREGDRVQMRRVIKE